MFARFFEVTDSLSQDILKDVENNLKSLKEANKLLQSKVDPLIDNFLSSEMGKVHFEISNEFTGQKFGEF